MYFSKSSNVFIHIQLWDKIRNQVWKIDRDVTDLKLHFLKLELYLSNFAKCIYVYIVKCVSLNCKMYFSLNFKMYLSTSIYGRNSAIKFERQTETLLIWSFICSNQNYICPMLHHVFLLIVKCISLDYQMYLSTSNYGTNLAINFERQTETALLIKSLICSNWKLYLSNFLKCISLNG